MTWFQLFAEFVAVFLGVSLSFWVEEYRERRAERRIATQVLLGLRDDVAAELPTVNWLRNVYGSTAEAGAELYRNWREIPNAQDHTQQVFTAAHAGAPFSPARTHYETAKSQGILRLIENRELRSKIASLFEQQQTYLSGISQRSTEFDFEFFRRLRPYIEYGEVQGSIDLPILPVKFKGLPQVSILPELIENLAGDNVVRNSLHLSALFRQVFVDLLTGYEKALRELDSAIENALSGKSASTQSARAEKGKSRPFTGSR